MCIRDRFFTPYETAKYMAQLFSIPAQTVIRILDPGAGSGVLAAALIERILKIRGVEKIELICYENNSSIIPLLESNLSYILSLIHICFKRSCAKSGVLAEVRKREHYESPSVKRRKKSEAARKNRKKFY